MDIIPPKNSTHRLYSQEDQIKLSEKGVMLWQKQSDDQTKMSEKEAIYLVSLGKDLKNCHTRIGLV